MVGGEGHTVSERVGPRGADNATNPELVCLPCAQLGNQLGGAPTQKKMGQKPTIWSKVTNFEQKYNFLTRTAIFSFPNHFFIFHQI